MLYGHMMRCCQFAADATYSFTSTDDLTAAVFTPSSAAEAQTGQSTLKLTQVMLRRH